MSSPKSGMTEPATARKGSSLILRNIRVGQHRTSIRFEPFFWNCLEEIGRRERLSMHQICTIVAYKLRLIDIPGTYEDALQSIRDETDFQTHNRHPVSDSSLPEFRGTLTSAIRVFILAYFVKASASKEPAPSGSGNVRFEQRIDDIFTEASANTVWDSGTSRLQRRRKKTNSTVARRGVG